MRVALGSDHGGFELKQEIIKYLEEKKHRVHRLSDLCKESCTWDSGRRV